jgi:molybdopterin molybdotransferase/putative molybdopterin biosynthesis protein
MAEGTIFTRDEILRALFELWAPVIARETVKTADAYGRVTANDEFAAYDLPVVRASAMDGIGVDAGRFVGVAPDTSAWREGDDYVRADTGDDFDDRFDAVIQIEAVRFTDTGGIVLEEGLEVVPGLNVRARGSSVKKGSLLVRSGTVLRPFDLAALVMGGITDLEVRKRPRAAFIPTGNELVAAGTAPRRGENINSNSIMAEYMLREMGAEPIIFDIVRDDPAALREAIDEAHRVADIIIVNGGSSKGVDDYNTRALIERGEFITHYVLAAPGRPMSVAVSEGKPIVNVPGPPLAAYFVLDWCVRAAVAHALGVCPPVRKKITAKVTANIGDTGNMEILRKLNVERTAEGYLATPVGGSRGASTCDVLTAEAQYVTRPGSGGIASGQSLEIDYLR